MAKLRKQHADYTLLKNKHQLATNGDIYDSDYFTTIQGDGFLGDQMEIFSESNFKFSVSTRENSKKVRYSRRWDEHDGCETDDTTCDPTKWSLNYIKPSNTSESSIVLKSDYNSLQDFAYYGSALELVKSSMNDIIMNFPAGIFFTASGEPDNKFWVSSKAGNYGQFTDSSQCGSGALGAKSPETRMTKMGSNVLGASIDLSTPLTFESLEDDNDITFSWWAGVSDAPYYASYILYKTSADTEYLERQITRNSGSVTITVNSGDTVSFCGSAYAWSKTQDGEYSCFSSTKDVNVFGNIISMLDGSGFTNNPGRDLTSSEQSAFTSIFRGMETLKSAEFLLLPSKKLSVRCYTGMFAYCINLEIPPNLPATGLSNYCYSYMFTHCDSLEKGPDLNASQLAEWCYSFMFYSCDSLIDTPIINANYCASACCLQMFWQCNELTGTQETLGASLAPSCYASMFSECKKITKPPFLPQENLENSCYEGMFHGCTNLSESPELPARNLVKNCYKDMFNGCSSLSSITCLATDISANGCTTNWVNGVSPTGRFNVPEEMEQIWEEKRGVDGVPEGWCINEYPCNKEITISGNTDYTLCPNDNEPHVFTVISTSDWEISGDTSDVTFHPHSGTTTNGQPVTFRYPISGKEIQLYAKIDDEHRSESVKIYKKGETKIEISPKTFDTNGGELTVLITADSKTHWDLSITEIGTTGGTGSTGISFTIPQNKGTSPKTYKLKLSDSSCNWESSSSVTVRASASEDGCWAYEIYNPFNIDIVSESANTEVENPLRYLALSVDDYVVNGEEQLDWKPCRYDVGCNLDSYEYGVFIGEASLNGERVCVFYDSGTYHYLMLDEPSEMVITPKQEIIEREWSKFGEFERILLDRSSNPAYTAYFDTPYETEYGNEYSREAYTWPSIGDDNTGYYLPELNTAAYYNYVGKLVDLAIFYDSYWSDNIWRSMTHEAIRNLDWTFTKENGDDTETIHDIDSKKIEMMARLWGRNSDDVKRYIDNIKNSNRVTYDQKNNVPDYFLTDQVEIGGIDPVSLNLSPDNYARTDNLGYDAYGKSFGFTASDANNEVFRRLKINERYLTSVKGTVEGVKAMLAILGIPDSDYIITEYVAIAHNFPNADDVARLNLSRTSKLEKIASSELEGDYDGLPVVRVGVGDTAGTGDYVIPWYDKRETYDNGIYFQMYGGWGKRPQKKVYFEDEDTPRTIYSVEGKFGIYDEAVQRLKFARDEEDMNMNIPVDTLRKGDICFVENVPESNFGDPELSGTTGTSEDIEIFAHYYKWDGSWMCINMIPDIEMYASGGTLNLDRMKAIYVATLIDAKEGNNQHTGYGEYDDGMMYIEKLDNIFGEFCEDFIEAGEATWNEAMSGYTFEISDMEPDRQKCWFFKNETEELESGATLSARDNSEPTLCNFDNKAFYGDGYINSYKVFSENCCQTADVRDAIYEPYNQEGGEICDEAASFSVVNIKNMDIQFKFPCPAVVSGERCENGSIDTDEFYEEFRKYIDDVVMFYVKQMVPSTTILSYKFISNGIIEGNPDKSMKMNNVIGITVS